MQTLQLLGGATGRARFWRCARAHLEPGGVLAAAIVSALAPYAPAHPGDLPLPDLHERDGWVYASQPVAIHPRRHATTIERMRETVSPEGERTRRRDVVRLDRLDVVTAAAEAERAGLAALAPREIPATRDHLGSEVVVLGAA
jgi:hypothetical protein